MFEYFIGGTAAYFGSLILWDVLPNTFSKRIRSQEELEKIVDEEAKKLDLDTSNLIIQLQEKDVADANLFGYNREEDKILSYEEKEGVEKVHLLRLGGQYATRHQVRHELYHVSKHLQKPKAKNFISRLGYLFFREPSAILYSLIGVKL